jgi:hypothetical protein
MFENVKPWYVTELSLQEKLAGADSPMKQELAIAGIAANGVASTAPNVASFNLPLNLSLFLSIAISSDGAASTAYLQPVRMIKYH